MYLDTANTTGLSMDSTSFSSWNNRVHKMLRGYNHQQWWLNNLRNLLSLQCAIQSTHPTSTTLAFSCHSYTKFGACHFDTGFIMSRIHSILNMFLQIPCFVPFTLAWRYVLKAFKFAATGWAHGTWAVPCPRPPGTFSYLGNGGWMV